MKNIKKWLIKGTTTFAIIMILISLFLLISTLMQKLDLKPIDLTPEKTYTLTKESIEKISKVEKNVNIYLIGYSEDDTATVLAKQYNKNNNKINVEAVDITKRTDLSEKYGIDSTDSSGIIVDCGEKYKVLTSNDLYTYDINTYESIDITEEKLTSSILTVTSEKIPNVYFLTGYSDFSLTTGMSYFSQYLENEIIEVKELDLVAKKSVPDDCDTLVITTPNKDFIDIVSDAIIKYINKGGNILWLNSSYGTEKNMPNVNKVLETFGINPFNSGYIVETDIDKMLSGAPYMVLPDVQYSDSISKINTVLFAEPTKINIKDDDKLSQLKVEKENILTTSKSSYFRKDLTIKTSSKTESDIAGEFVVGAKLTKTIKDDLKSTLIIFGDNYFISDTTVSEGSKTPILLAYDNKDLVLNSIAFLTDKKENISIRKTTDTVSYTATEKQDIIIRIVIFAVPCLIILMGIIVWYVRRRKK